jgi:hypothetical protein
MCLLGGRQEQTKQKFPGIQKLNLSGYLEKPQLGREGRSELGLSFLKPHFQAKYPGLGRRDLSWRRQCEGVIAPTSGQASSAAVSVDHSCVCYKGEADYRPGQGNQTLRVSLRDLPKLSFQKQYSLNHTHAPLNCEFRT